MALATPFKPGTRILPVYLLRDGRKEGRLEESVNEDVINLLWDSPHRARMLTKEVCTMNNHRPTYQMLLHERHCCVERRHADKLVQRIPLEAALIACWSILMQRLGRTFVHECRG